MLERLRARRAVVADRWFRAIAYTSFVPAPASEVRAKLDELTGRAMDALLAEELSDEEARDIGASIARLHYLTPAALACSLQALGHDLLEGLDEDHGRGLEPRLIDFLAQVGSGFYDEGRRMILAEQEAIRRALFVSRQEAEAAEEARAIAEASAQARSDLLGRVAHDLRSPLTSVKGQSDLIAMRLEREPPARDWLLTRVQAIRAAADRMDMMIGELLDAARLQLGHRLELDLAPLDLAELGRQVATRLEGPTGRIHIDAEDAPLLVTADRVRFERVLENVLSNALKYSPEDAPVLMVLRRTLDGARLSVRDLGVGIPAGEIARVTEPFYRASTARAVPGIGLGLAGVRVIVEQHGGHLEIESVVGEGTQVSVTVPAAP